MYVGVVKILFCNGISICASTYTVMYNTQNVYRYAINHKKEGEKQQIVTKYSMQTL
jgi:hypothetical protein